MSFYVEQLSFLYNNGLVEANLNLNVGKVQTCLTSVACLRTCLIREATAITINTTTPGLTKPPVDVILLEIMIRTGRLLNFHADGSPGSSHLKGK